MLVLRKKLLSYFTLLLFILLAQLAAAQTRTFKGVVVDYDFHTPVEGITVSVKGKKIATNTDSSGRFELQLPIDNYTLVFSSLDYHKTNIPIHIAESNFETFYIKKKPLKELPEVTVETASRSATVANLQMSNVQINASQIKKMPLAFGEADVMRALALQPGIITAGETVSSYYVRGGNADQNLILLDGAPLFNVAHLLGFYSGINADAIQDITFYKGAIPAMYGSRLSSVMLLNAKQGNPDTMRYSGGIGFISSRMMLEGPIVKDKLTVMAAGRIAYPKLMMNLFPGDVANSDAFYYDGILKLAYTPNINNRINFTFYNSYDKYKFPGDTAYSWKNYAGVLSWRSNISNKLSVNISGNFSKYASSINGLDKQYAFRLASVIQQKEARAAAEYAIAGEQKIAFGGGFTYYTLNPGNLKGTGNGSAIVNKTLQAENAGEWNAFISSENKITKFLSAQIGVRFTFYQYLGEHTIYNYLPGEPRKPETITDSVFYQKNKAISQYHSIEPRLLLRVLLDSSTSIKLSYNKIQQYLHLITNTTSVTPVDYWKLSGPYILPEVSDNYSIGFFKDVGKKYSFSLEGYYRTTDNTIEYKNGADLYLNPAIETQVLPAQNYAYGAELSVRKNTGMVTGGASYTYSRVFTKVLSDFAEEQVNGGEYYPGNVDRPNNFVLSASVKLGKGWLFSSNFVYTTGRPATYPDGSYIINNTIVTNYSVRNQDRLPDYHRLDISFSHDTRRYPGQKRYSVLNFSFYNVYLRKNVYSLYFKREGNQIKAYKLSVIGSIIPSISWSFNF